jgi:hypothetical protein
MERGDLSGVSESVLFALVRALRLDEAEKTHLFDLARAATGPRRALRTKSEPRVPPCLAQLLDTMRDVPALALNRLGTPVASNALGRALFPHLFPDNTQPINHARYLFLDERSQTFYLDWETSARESVSSLRLLSGQDPTERALASLVGELATPTKTSAPGGAATRSESTPVVPSGSSTPSSANLPSDTTSSPCIPHPGSTSPPTSRNRDLPHQMPWPCSKAGSQMLAPPPHQKVQAAEGHVSDLAVAAWPQPGHGYL